MGTLQEELGLKSSTECARSARAPPQHWPEMVFPAGSLRWHCSCAGNDIDDEGMAALSEALKSNSSLTSVFLLGMPVRHHMNVRCMCLRLCCVAPGLGRRCCHGALVQDQAF